MKKIFALALALVLCLSIVACRNSEDDKDGETTTTAVTTEGTEATTTEATTEATTTSGPIVEPDDARDPAVDDIF